MPTMVGLKKRTNGDMIFLVHDSIEVVESSNGGSKVTTRSSRVFEVLESPETVATLVDRGTLKTAFMEEEARAKFAQEFLAKQQGGLLVPTAAQHVPRNP